MGSLNPRFVSAAVVVLVVLGGFIFLSQTSKAPTGEEAQPSLPGEAVPLGVAPTSPEPTPTTAVQPATTSPAAKKPTPPPAKSAITFLSPAANEEWVIGEPHIIKWSRGSVQMGSLSLLNATTKKVVGWILSSANRNQASHQWDTRSVFISRGSPSSQDLAPGSYVLHLIFDGPEVAVESAPFSIIYPSQVGFKTHQIVIAGLKMSPDKLTVKQGDKVVFTNNDSVNHFLKLSVSYPTETITVGGSYVLPTISLTPGQYEAYSDKYQTAKTIITVQ